MKAKSIDATYTTADAVAITTEPPLTQEVFEALESNNHSEISFSFEYGLLVVSASQPLTPRATEIINEMLGEAIEKVARQKKEAENTRKRILNKWTQATGLPVE